MSKLAGPRLVEEAKVTGYLLSTTHHDGRAKAAFFARFGYDPGEAARFTAALLMHPVPNNVVETIRTGFGVKTVVECSLPTPDGRNPCIRTIWVREHGTDLHRLVTAYPAG